MREGWKEVQLGDITSLVKRGVAPKYVEENGYVIINQKCIRDGVLTFTDARLTSFEKKITEEKFVTVGDVLINSTGTGTLGRTAVVRKLDKKTTVDTHVTIVRGNDFVDGLFLGYLMSYHEPLITALGKGATNQIELSATDLKITKVKIPEFKSTQRKIASILSAYDDLIENNLKRIKLLEEKAQLTYEEWFVRMKFPGHETAVFDEESGLPEGWVEVKLGEFVKTSSGGTPSKKKEEEYYNNGTIPYVRTGELKKFMLINSELKITEAGLKNSSAKLFPKNTVLLAMYGNTIGEVTFSRIETSTNQACCAFLPENPKVSFYLHLFFLNNKEYVLSHRMGAAQENISQSIIQNLSITIPKDAIIDSFGDLMIIIYDVIESLLNQNQLLKEARDILLPRLMSGMVDVEEIITENINKVEDSQQRINLSVNQ